MEIDEDTIAAILAKLAEALNILGEIPPPDPDMGVDEWNATPIGRACSRIQNAIDKIEGEEE